jgi:predicted metal-dependent phosphoesterase TrpH
LSERINIYEFLGRHKVAVSATLCICLLLSFRVYTFESTSQKTPSATYVPLISDFHVHTNLSDGFYSPAEVVRIYKSYDYDVIAITDHVTIAGYEEARAEGQELGLIVIRGEETGIRLLDGNTIHISALFINTSIPAYWQSNQTNGPEYCFNQIHVQNGIGIAAHPWKSWIDWKDLQYESYIDGWEYGQEETYAFKNWLLHSDSIYLLTHDFHRGTGEDLPSYYTVLLAHNRTEAGVREALESRRIILNYWGKYYGTPGNLELFAQKKGER